MKIGFISMIRDPWGGSEELWYEAGKQALKEGHTVFHSAFYCGSEHPKILELKKMGTRVFYRRGYVKESTSPKKKLLIQLWNLLKNQIDNPYSALFKQNPDIIVYTGTAYSIGKEKYLQKYLRNKKFNFFIIVQLNVEDYRTINNSETRIIHEAYSRSNKIFFVSERNLKIAQHHLFKLLPNAKVLRNPVNVDANSPPPYPAGTLLQFAMVGNLNTIHKGQDIVLRILGSPEWERREFTLNIYGYGPDEHYLKSLVEFYTLHNKVFFHGKVSDISGIWALNHLLIMPSHMEGMPLAVVEAMLCERPTVATDVGGITEWITDGKHGFIADGANFKCLSLALDRAWNNKDMWQEMGIEARKQALKLYDPHTGRTLLNELLIKE